VAPLKDGIECRLFEKLKPLLDRNGVKSITFEYFCIDEAFFEHSDSVFENVTGVETVILNGVRNQFHNDAGYYDMKCADKRLYFQSWMSDLLLLKLRPSTIIFSSTMVEGTRIFNDDFVKKFVSVQPNANTPVSLIVHGNRCLTDKVRFYTSSDIIPVLSRYESIRLLSMTVHVNDLMQILTDRLTRSWKGVWEFCVYSHMEMKHVYGDVVGPELEFESHMTHYVLKRKDNGRSATFSFVAHSLERRLYMIYAQFENEQMAV
ncbi:hypothetical protein PFISCL1PPCAC_21400, partial [Pristionchus fissidentatus]